MSSRTVMLSGQADSGRGAARIMPLEAAAQVRTTGPRGPKAERSSFWTGSARAFTEPFSAARASGRKRSPAGSRQRATVWVIRDTSSRLPPNGAGSSKRELGKAPAGSSALASATAACRFVSERIWLEPMAAAWSAAGKTQPRAARAKARSPSS
jgi:hypothetical protein